MPIVIVRLGVAVLFGIGLMLYAGLAGGLAWLLGHIAEWLGAVVGIGAFVGVVPIYIWFSRYVLYVLKAAHVAVIATYEEATRDLTPDPVWGAKLEGMSAKYRDLSDRAAHAFRSVHAPGAGPL